MQQFKLDKVPYPLVLELLSPSDIKITVSPSNLELPEDIEEQIENIWAVKQKEVTEKGLNFYNGTSYRLNDWKYDDGILYIDFSIFDYKHRYGLMTLTKNGQLDESKYRHNGCYVGGTVKTSDGKYLMVELSGKSTNTNKYDVLGGILETDVSCDSGEYIFNVMRNELLEEADIEAGEITKMTLEMFFVALTGHIGFYMDVELSITAEELQERAKSNKDIDIESLLLFSKEEYITTLRKSSAAKVMFANIVDGESISGS